MIPIDHAWISTQLYIVQGTKIPTNTTMTRVFITIYTIAGTAKKML